MLGADCAGCLATGGRCAYFCGCFNGAVIVSKYILRDDVRTHGSGNAGLTNFLPHLRRPADLCGHPAPTCSRRLWPSGVGAVCWLPALPAGVHAPMTRWANTGRACSACWGTCSPVCSTSRGARASCPAATIAIMIDWRVALVVLGGLSDPGAADPVCVPGLHAGPGPRFPFATWSASIATGCSLLLAIAHRRSDPLEAPGEHPAAARTGHRDPRFYFHQESKVKVPCHENCCVGQRRLGDGPGHAAGGERPRL